MYFNICTFWWATELQTHFETFVSSWHQCYYNVICWQWYAVLSTCHSTTQSTHLFEYNSHSGWLQKTNTHKFDIKIIKNNQIMVIPCPHFPGASIRSQPLLDCIGSTTHNKNTHQSVLRASPKVLNGLPQTVLEIQYLETFKHTL